MPWHCSAALVPLSALESSCRCLDTPEKLPNQRAAGHPRAGPGRADLRVLHFESGWAT